MSFWHFSHGDVVQLTNAQGAVQKDYWYDGFGVEINPDQNDNQPFRYCSEYWDNETESYYLRARMYNPGLSRFNQEDPIRAGLNWYTYCVGNPILYYDPSGYGNEKASGSSAGPLRAAQNRTQQMNDIQRGAGVKSLESLPITNYLEAAVGRDLYGNELDAEQRLEKLDTG